MYFVTYKILMNGSPKNQINPLRGLRQCNHLFSFLFLLYAERLSFLIHHKRIKKISSIKIKPCSPIISHLLFVDDCYILSKVDKKEIDTITNIIREFSESLDQTINFEKFELIFNLSTPKKIRNFIQGVLQIKQGQSSSKYLGLLSFIGRNKSS